MSFVTAITLSLLTAYGAEPVLRVRETGVQGVFEIVPNRLEQISQSKLARVVAPVNTVSLGGSTKVDVALVGRDEPGSRPLLAIWYMREQTGVPNQMRRYIDSVTSHYSKFRLEAVSSEYAEEARNVEVGLSRAEQVRRYMQTLGIPGDDIGVLSRGTSVPTVYPVSLDGAGGSGVVIIYPVGDAL